MQVIKNNPYRIIGIIPPEGLRGQTRQANRLKQYVEAGQEAPDDFSFPALGRLNRTLESIYDAVSKLNLNNDRINAALFWFYNGSHIDEASFDSIKDNNLQEAIKIWERRTSSGEVSHSNHSAFQNLSTLKLLSAFNNGTINTTFLEEGISLKLKFLESDFVNEFKEKIADETFKATKKDLQLSFLKCVQGELEKDGGISHAKFIEILSGRNFSAKEDFLKTYAEVLIVQIQKSIDNSKTKRKANKANAAVAAKELHEVVAKDMIQLNNTLGTTSLKYSSIADKVSDELLQCGIEHFSHNKDSNTDPSTITMLLFKYAKQFAVGNIAKQRFEDNMTHLQGWIDDKPQRDKEKLIGDDLRFISSKLEGFQKTVDSTANARTLIQSCKPKLLNIKSALGYSDDFYLKVSSAVVNNVQGMLVTLVNDEQTFFSYASNPSQENLNKAVEVVVRRNKMPRTLAVAFVSQSLTDQFGAMTGLKNVITGALDVSKSLGELDMTNELRVKYNSNHSTLQSIANRLNIGSSRPTYSPSNSSTSSSEEGIPRWAIWIGVIILFIILSKACN